MNARSVLGVGLTERYVQSLPLFRQRVPFIEVWPMPTVKGAARAHVPLARP